MYTSYITSTQVNTRHTSPATPPGHEGNMGYYKNLAYDKMVARRDGGSFTRPRQQTQPVPVKVASMAIAAGANGSYHLWTVDDLKKAFNRGYAVTTHDGQQVTNDTLLTLPGSGKAHKVSALLDGSFVNL